MRGRTVALVGVAVVAVVALGAVLASVACGQGTGSPEERLRRHYEEVIKPETEAPLVLIAESCDQGDSDACQTFGVLAGEVAAVRLGRYWEAMRWIGVDDPGEEILGELVAIGDYCDYLASRYAADEESVAGMCSYFRSQQMPYEPGEDGE